MNPYENLQYENSNGIGLVTLCRPQALNALNKAMIEELDHLFDRLTLDETVKAVVITGSGSKSFVAGADITEMQSLSVEGGREWARLGQSVLIKLKPCLSQSLLPLTVLH